MMRDDIQADVAELADAPDLGSGSERSEGSSPFIRISKSSKRSKHSINKNICQVREKKRTLSHKKEGGYK